MKTTLTILLAGLLILSLTGAVGAMDERHLKVNDCTLQGSNLSIDFDDDGTLCLEHRAGKRDVVEITADYTLYINHRRIKTDDEADALLEEYYHQTKQLVAEAKKIGLKAGKIGLRGGALGLSAVSGVLRVFLTDYDGEDFERDLEYEAEKLEAEAEKLEDDADELEEIADEIEGIADELSREVPELRRLRWFYE